MKLTLRCKFATSYLRTFTFEVQELSDVVISKDDVFIEASESEVDKVKPAIYKLLSKDFDLVLHKYLKACVMNYNADGDADKIVNETIDDLKEKYSIDFTLADQLVFLNSDNELYFQVMFRTGSRSEFQLDQDDLYTFKTRVLEEMFKKLFTNRAILHSGTICDDKGTELIASFSVALAFQDVLTTAHLFAEQEVN